MNARQVLKHWATPLAHHELTARMWGITWPAMVLVRSDRSSSTREWGGALTPSTFNPSPSCSTTGLLVATSETIKGTFLVHGIPGYKMTKVLKPHQAQAHVGTATCDWGSVSLVAFDSEGCVHVIPHLGGVVSTVLSYPLCHTCSQGPICMLCSMSSSALTQLCVSFHLSLK